MSWVNLVIGSDPGSYPSHHYNFHRFFLSTSDKVVLLFGSEGSPPMTDDAPSGFSEQSIKSPMESVRCKFDTEISGSGLNGSTMTCSVPLISARQKGHPPPPSESCFQKKLIKSSIHLIPGYSENSIVDQFYFNSAIFPFFWVSSLFEPLDWGI